MRSLAVAIFCAPLPLLADGVVDHETQHFSVKVVQELEAFASPLLNKTLDQCAEETGLLKFRTSQARIPFFVARDKRTLDALIQDHYAGQITLTEDTYVDDTFCGDPASGTLFVTGETISLCVGDEAYWSKRIQYNEICSDITHEMVHIVQNDLTDGGLRAPGQSLTEVVGPAWLFEGVAVLFSQISSFGKDRLDRVVQLSRNQIPPNSFTLAEMERFDRRAEYGRLHYQKGFIAAKYLLDRTDEDAIFDFYRCVGPSEEWEICFERAFDMSVDRFYTTQSSQ
ncbi:hypothetical protein [uncultured Tateyamaria sp.]|uniref:hypothetical protein n=1 Tax=uncultured Tateyamaria sp. TaxID=455651 RepID=UPI0026343AD8|nr:hypothetical protein [uncultured Tateyamaria sp.]